MDEDYYPVEGAVVTLKRTNQNATTDKDGVFILEEVPVYFDSLQVKKGKRSGYIDLPMRIQMRTQVMQRFSWSVNARQTHANAIYFFISFCFLHSTSNYPFPLHQKR